MTITETQQGWARISADGTTIQKRTFDPPNLEKRPGQPYWLPAFEIIDDQSTPETPVNQSSGDPVIEAERVSKTITITDQTPGEIDDTLDESITDHADSITGRVEYDVNNRIRVLEGKSPFTTRAEFEQWVKSVVTG